MRLLPLISLLIIAAPAVALLAYVVHSSRQQKYSRLPLNLVGRVASVERALDPEGFVLIEGELGRGGRRPGVFCLNGGGGVARAGARRDDGRARRPAGARGRRERLRVGGRA